MFFPFFFFFFFFFCCLFRKFSSRINGFGDPPTACGRTTHGALTEELSKEGNQAAKRMQEEIERLDGENIRAGWAV